MNPNDTRIAIVLDRSGSMESVRAATIAGFNEFVEGQKAAPGTATLILNQFDDVFETVFDCPLQSVPPLTPETFQPRGTTALLDAMGRTIDELGAKLAALPDQDRPGKVIVVIVTDGQENASLQYSTQQVNQKITHQREKYGWDFIFLGANQDAITSAAQFGIQSNAALTYAATPAGTRASFAAASRASRARRESNQAPVFSDLERSQAKPKPV